MGDKRDDDMKEPSEQEDSEEDEEESESSGGNLFLASLCTMVMIDCESHRKLAAPNRR
jgi:hypothetical protein